MPSLLRERPRVLFSLAFFLLSLSIACFDWPVDDPALLATFGETRYGHYGKGVDIGGGEQQVFTIADGEMIFCHEEGESFYSLKRGNGSFVIIQHEGEIRSIYSHLKKDSIVKDRKLYRVRPNQIDSDTFGRSILNRITDEEPRTVVLQGFQKSGDRYLLREDLTIEQRSELWRILSEIGFVHPIGVSGDTGLSEGVQLSLMLIDNEVNTILNPIKKDKPFLRPPLPSETATGPRIGAVQIKRGETVRELQSDLNLTPGDGEIIAEIYDRSDYVSYNRKMAPYRIYLGESGKVVRTITFDALVEMDGRLVLSGTDLSCDDLYLDEWFYRLGTLTLVEGKSQIQIRAEDFLGRESSADISIGVRTE
jgi:hypothetical protein